MVFEKAASETVSDREYLRLVTRKMLQKIEQALDAEMSFKPSENTSKTHNRVFGAKTSLASTLVTLAKLLLQLGAEEKIFSGTQSIEKPFSDGDIALVESFVSKMKNSNTTPAPQCDLLAQ